MFFRVSWGPCWAIWGPIGALSGAFGVSWGPFWGVLEVILGHLGAYWGAVGGLRAVLGAVLGPRGAYLGPGAAISGASFCQGGFGLQKPSKTDGFLRFPGGLIDIDGGWVIGVWIQGAPRSASRARLIKQKKHPNTNREDLTRRGPLARRIIIIIPIGSSIFIRV